MLLTIAAVGRLKAGPERDLFDRYLARAEGAGKKLALTFAVREIPESRAAGAVERKTQEASALVALMPRGATLVALDEGGTNLDSRAFSERIGKWRDDGAADIVLALGGADGHGEAILKKAALRLALGAMTWPHQLARLMLAEQLYRTVTILSGHPYHRD